MQRLEEIAEEIYQSSAAGKSKVAEPKGEAVPGEDAPGASEATPEEGTRTLMLANTWLLH